MARIEGDKEIIRNLLKQLKKAEETNVRGIVGYTAKYALWVHESVGMVLKGLPRPKKRGVYWGPKGQAKFLEQPFRTMRDELYDLVLQTVRAGKTLRQGIMIACLRLQRESMKLVPIVTGNLRASAFTRMEKT